MGTGPFKLETAQCIALLSKNFSERKDSRLDPLVYVRVRTFKVLTFIGGGGKRFKDYANYIKR